jgi:Uma2 family endonuclease
MSDTLHRADKPSARVPYPAPHRWSTAEYHQLAEGGFFGSQRVELVEGTVIDMSPMGRPHWVACQVAADTLRSVFGAGYFITTNLPAYLSEFSEPEPDVAVLPGEPRDYVADRPTLPLLVVEVSETSLEYDRTTKSSLYARYAVPEYWIINLRERTIEVHREPAPDPLAPYGYRYGWTGSFYAHESLAPLTLPAVQVPASRLLP